MLVIIIAYTPGGLLDIEKTAYDTSALSKTVLLVTTGPGRDFFIHPFLSDNREVPYGLKQCALTNLHKAVQLNDFKGQLRLNISNLKVSRIKWIPTTFLLFIRTFSQSKIG